MTSRERLLAAMKFQEVDRVPVAPFGLGCFDPDSAIAQELVEKTDPFIPVGIPGDFIFGAACETQTSKDGDITTIVRKTPKGNLVQKIRTTPITSATIEYPLKTPDDAEKFFSIDYRMPVVDASHFHAEKKRIDEQGMVLCGMLDAVLVPAELLSPEDFCLWWADYPELLKQITNLAAIRIIDWVQELCEAGVDAFRIVGGEYASVELGPKGFDALVLEQDKELVDLIHIHKGIAYYHNHGPVMQYITRFREIGMDALDPLEAPPWGDADLRAARELTPDKVAFVGNLDDMEILEKKDFDTIAALALERLDAAGQIGFILGGTASGTYTEVAARNFMRLVDVVKRAADGRRQS